MREWNAFDNAIYEHFNATFWEKVEMLPNFEEEMNTLDKKLEEIKKTCLAGEKICKPLDKNCQYNPGGGVKIKQHEVSVTSQRQ